MRKIISGRVYNTATSYEVGRWVNDYGRSDFQHCRESLYKNSRGAYFLYGEGGPMSIYAISSGNNSWGGGENITPLSVEEAQAWAEGHLDAGEYESEFGEAEEAEPSDLATRERVNLTVDSELYQWFREYAKSTEIPMSRLIDRAIRETYQGPSKP